MTKNDWWVLAALTVIIVAIIMVTSDLSFRMGRIDMLLERMGR